MSKAIAIVSGIFALVAGYYIWGMIQAVNAIAKH